MKKYLTIDETGRIRRFAAPDVDTIRAWAGRNGFVLTKIEPVPSPGRWDVFQALTDSTASGASPVTPTGD